MMKAKKLRQEQRKVAKKFDDIRDKIEKMSDEEYEEFLRLIQSNNYSYSEAVKMVAMAK